MMKIDDPRLTAYALGELPEVERRSIEQESAASPEAQAYVFETRQLATKLEDEFRAELESADPAAANILPMPYARLFWSEPNWPVLAIAAVLVASFTIASVLFWRSDSPRSTAATSLRKSATPANGDIVVEYLPDEESRMLDAAAAENEKPFASVSAIPVSIFPMRTGSGSFAEVRNSLAEGRRPPKSAVRIEEMINHFTYTYPEPTTQLVTISLDAATCPWFAGHELIRVAVHSRDEQAARFVEVRFNPAQIKSYRLLGYDEAHAAADAAPGDSTLRRTVTALYEVIPYASDAQAATGAAPELLTATVRRENSSSEALAQGRLTADVSAFENAPTDFRFAAAVAEFGLLLRDSPYKGSADIASIVRFASSAEADDGERAEFVELLQKSESFL